MEAINDATRLIAQAIEELKYLSQESKLLSGSHEHAIDLLKQALDKLVVEI